MLLARGSLPAKRCFSTESKYFPAPPVLLVRAVSDLRYGMYRLPNRFGE